MDASFLNLDLPSRRKELLYAMVGEVIVGLSRFDRRSREQYREFYGMYNYADHLIFSFMGGPIVVDFVSGLVVRAGSQPSLGSVLIGIDRDRSGQIQRDMSKAPLPELHHLDVFDPTFSNDQMRHFVGKLVTSVSVLKEIDTRSEWAPMEAGVVLTCADGSKLILSRGLQTDTDDSSVITPDQIDPDMALRLKEYSLSELEEWQD